MIRNLVINVLELSSARDCEHFVKAFFAFEKLRDNNYVIIWKKNYGFIGNSSEEL